MPISPFMHPNRTLAFAFFAGLALIAAQMTWVIYQQQQVLNNQEIGLARSAFTYNTTQTLVEQAENINGNATQNILTHRSLIENQNMIADSFWHIENMLENLTSTAKITP